MKCYNCNEEGHASRDCTQARVGGAFGADKKCYVSLGCDMRWKSGKLTLPCVS